MHVVMRRVIIENYIWYSIAMKNWYTLSLNWSAFVVTLKAIIKTNEFWTFLMYWIINYSVELRMKFNIPIYAWRFTLTVR